MKKNMLKKVRRTGRTRFTNSVCRMLERKKLPRQGELVLAKNRYWGQPVLCVYDGFNAQGRGRRGRFWPCDKDGILTGRWSYSRFEIQEWRRAQ